jgi:glutaredoxin 3
MTIASKRCQNGSEPRIKSARTAMQPNIEIYTWQSCPFCIRAKALLNKKGVEFTEYSIGGCDDLHDLDDRGKLNALLGIAA